MKMRFFQLLDGEVSSPEDFVWLSRLRYYSFDNNDDKNSKRRHSRTPMDDDDAQLELLGDSSRAAFSNANSKVELRMMHSVVPYG